MQAEVSQGEMKAVTQLKTPYNQSISENMLARGRPRHKRSVPEMAAVRAPRFEIL